MNFRVIALLFWILSSNLAAQGLEAGVHTGAAILNRQPEASPLGTEKRPQWGIFAAFWTTPQLALTADWAYIPRADFHAGIGAFPVGETDRNRQYVDVSLRFHFQPRHRSGFYAGVGGGGLWNNRMVVNPERHPDFPRPGLLKSRSSSWSFHLGHRANLSPRVHWHNELRVHDFGSESMKSTRIVTGFSFSLF